MKKSFIVIILLITISVILFIIINRKFGKEIVIFDTCKINVPCEWEFTRNGDKFIFTNKNSGNIEAIGYIYICGNYEKYKGFNCNQDERFDIFKTIGKRIPNTNIICSQVFFSGGISAKEEMMINGVTEIKSTLSLSNTDIEIEIIVLNDDISYEKVKKIAKSYKWY